MKTKWVFEADSYSQFKDELEQTSKDLEARCLAEAQKTRARFPEDNGATATAMALWGNTAGLFCFVSIAKHGVAECGFYFGSRAYAQRARKLALELTGKDKHVSTGFEKPVSKGR